MIFEYVKWRGGPRTSHRPWSLEDQTFPRWVTSARCTSHAGRVRISFGWGTNLTNDFVGCAPDGSADLDPISLVCKVTSVDGRPAVKLSDNPEKAEKPAKAAKAGKPAKAAKVEAEEAVEPAGDEPKATEKPAKKKK